MNPAPLTSWNCTHGEQRARRMGIGPLSPLPVTSHLPLITESLTPLECMFTDSHFGKSFRMNVYVKSRGGAPLNDLPAIAKSAFFVFNHLRIQFFTSLFLAGDYAFPGRGGPTMFPSSIVVVQELHDEGRPRHSPLPCYNSTS